MTHIDFLILAIIAVSMLIGFFRGFFPEVIAVATWVVAAFGALQLSPLVEPYLVGKMGSGTVEMWTARAIAFVGLMIVGGLIGQLVSLVVDKAGLSGTDKTLGVAFGAIRGGFVVGVLVIFAQLIGFHNDPWWSNARLIPYAEAVATGIRAFLPEQVARFVEPSEPRDDKDDATDGTDRSPEELALDALESLQDAANAVRQDGQ